MNKPVHLSQAILDISKVFMSEFWYNYIKPKYGDNARLCYIDTDSFVINIKTEDFYKYGSIDDSIHLTMIKLMKDTSNW